ncbi:hypothetical protein KY343_04245 [Candidatus Woesearchaeota archaeon]|nr:hypothetical protein [Candidatus Woesearchaeota archaeon]
MNRDETIDIGMRAAIFYKTAKLAIRDGNDKKAAMYFGMAADEYKTLAENQVSIADRLAYREMEKECLEYTYINAKADPEAWKANEERIKDISDEIELLNNEGEIQ